MAESITIKFKDGTQRVFREQGRPGGSYTLSLTLENGFACVTDEWNQRTCFPSQDIAEVSETHRPRW